LGTRSTRGHERQIFLRAFGGWTRIVEASIDLGEDFFKSGVARQLTKFVEYEHQRVEHRRTTKDRVFDGFGLDGHQLREHPIKPLLNVDSLREVLVPCSVRSVDAGSAEVAHSVDERHCEFSHELYFRHPRDLGRREDVEAAPDRQALNGLPQAELVEL